MRHIVNALVFGLLSGFALNLYANPWAMDLNLKYAWADLSGFQQTPRGGSIGSTSHKRPSFEELGIRHHDWFGVELNLQYKEFLLGVEYLPIHLKGQTQLASPLITHNIPLMQGVPFHANVSDELYTATFGYIFSCPQTWWLATKLNVYWLSHDYQFNTPTAASSRAFGVSGVGLGLLGYYQLPYDFRVSLNANFTLGLTNLDVYQIQLGLGYPFELSGLTVTPSFSLGWQDITIKDNQTIPNYLKYTYSPTLGFQLNIHLGKAS